MTVASHVHVRETATRQPTGDTLARVQGSKCEPQDGLDNFIPTESRILLVGSGVP